MATLYYLCPTNLSKRVQSVTFQIAANPNRVIFFTDYFISKKICNQSTCKLTSSGVRVAIVVVEKQCVFCMCVCNLRYPACIANAPYCHLRPVRLCSIFAHYLINVTNFDKKLPKKNVRFDFLYIYLKHFKFLEEFREILS
jgi:hypothetical protein